MNAPATEYRSGTLASAVAAITTVLCSVLASLLRSTRLYPLRGRTFAGGGGGGGGGCFLLIRFCSFFLSFLPYLSELQCIWWHFHSLSAAATTTTTTSNYSSISSNTSFSFIFLCTVAMVFGWIKLDEDGKGRKVGRGRWLMMNIFEMPVADGGMAEAIIIIIDDDQCSSSSSTVHSSRHSERPLDSANIKCLLFLSSFPTHPTHTLSQSSEEQHLRIIAPIVFACLLNESDLLACRMRRRLLPLLLQMVQQLKMRVVPELCK